VTEAAKFLASFGRALSAASLYQDGHPTLERSVDQAWQDLTDLMARAPKSEFTFLGEMVFFADLPLREMRSWEWAERLSSCGLQRMLFSSDVTREGFVGFLFDVVARVSHTVTSATARQVPWQGIRSGSVALRPSGTDAVLPRTPIAALDYSMRDEVETVRWLHSQAATGDEVPLVEAETIVRSLSVAMHAGRGIVLPLVQLKDFDQYTTTHSLNVSVLAMALAEYLGLGDREVRAYGLAGLLHDLGKIRIPLEILTKPGRLTDQEREVMNQHPSDGARLILKSEDRLELAAVVAYEHHIMIDGGGYPSMRFGRECHRASRLVHVCDVFDALRTHRPYRDAWPLPKVMSYLDERAGLEFDPDLVRTFASMVADWSPRITVLTSEDEPVPVDTRTDPPAPPKG
jgi:putative nucleotidyltransferase with HDIG domain